MPPDASASIRFADRPFLQIAAALVGAYAASLAILALGSRAPDIPWSFVPFLLLVSLPTALVLVGLTHAVGPRINVPAGVWIATGVVAVWYSFPHVLWPTAALASLIAVPDLRSSRFFARLLSLLLLLIVGYATVWNFNAVLAPFSAGRLGDPWLVATDLWILSSTTYVGVFPIIESSALFTLLERSYLFLFAEILTATIWLTIHEPDDAPWWVARLFSAYAIGLVIFLIWPTVGPHIFAPESLRENWHSTSTFRTMQSMAHDYERIVAGGRGSINYFIAFPSLHVAAAVICQMAIRRSAPLFWLLLPITILVASSTFLLGYHYALDVPAGIATAWLAWLGVKRLRRAPR